MMLRIEFLLIDWAVVWLHWEIKAVFYCGYVIILELGVLNWDEITVHCFLVFSGISDLL